MVVFSIVFYKALTAEPFFTSQINYNTQMTDYIFRNGNMQVRRRISETNICHVACIL